MSHPFERADHDVRVFYSRVFWNVLLNLRAYELGVYPTLLCESDDPEIGLRWRQSIPQVVAAMKRIGSV